jgi:cation diffusion facilitator family transporter
MRSTVLGIGVNLVLALCKAAAGILGTSYALVADAVESVTDVFASLLVYVGLQVAARPADDDHPHGHGKAEPLAALAVALFLFLAAVGVAYQSIREILTPHLVPAPWTLLVLVGVILVKETLFRFVLNVGEAVGSSAVKGDAWHHRSDAITSAAAFVGIAVAVVGNRLNPASYWSSADDWAALLASGLIAFNGWGILRGALYELTDAHPGTEIEDEIRRVARTVPGVDSLHRCVIRKMGFDYYVELDVRVDPQMTVFDAHEIAHQVQDVVRADVEGARIARVLVHIEPTRPSTDAG